MGARARHDDAAISETSAVIMARLNDRLLEVTRAIQQRLATEIAELRDDSGLLELLGASVQGNVDTVFKALRYEIPIENVEPPTAALEYSRRMAQRGIPMNALVRAYRLSHEMVLDFAREEINNAGLDPGMSLAVFERMTTVTFRYIDWISQQVVVAYEQERDRWLENRNSVRAVRVREVLDATDVDLDAITSAIRYPMRRVHLGLVLWLPEDTGGGDELAALRGFSASSPNPLPPKIVRSLSRRTGSADGAGFRCSPGRPHRPSPTFDGSSRATTGRPRLRWSAAARSRGVPPIAPAGAAGAQRGYRRWTRRRARHRGERSRNVGRRSARRQHRRRTGVGSRSARTARLGHRQRFTVARHASGLPSPWFQLQSSSRRTHHALQFRQVSRAAGNRTSRP